MFGRRFHAAVIESLFLLFAAPLAHGHTQPPRVPQESAAYDFTLEVNLATAALRVKNAGGEIVARYPIAIPAPWVVRPIINSGALPIYAEVVAIHMNPAWKPTYNTRLDKSRDPRTGEFTYVLNEETGKMEPVLTFPAWVAPYSANKGNPLGVAFIELGSFSQRFVAPEVGIHGTSEPAKVSRGAMVSRGCIRNCNQYILEIVRMIRGKKTRVVFMYAEDPDDASVRTMPCDGIAPKSLP